MRGGQLAGWLAGWLVAGVMGAHVGAAAQSMGDGLGEVYPGGMVAARAVGVRGEMKCSTGGETWVVGVARSETSHSYRPYGTAYRDIDIDGTSVVYATHGSSPLVPRPVAMAELRFSGYPRNLSIVSV